MASLCSVEWPALQNGCGCFVLMKLQCKAHWSVTMQKYSYFFKNHVASLLMWKVMSIIFVLTL